MTIDKRFKRLNVLKSKMEWYTKQAEADLESGLRPDARNDNLPDDIKDFLEQHQFRGLD